MHLSQALALVKDEQTHKEKGIVYGNLKTQQTKETYMQKIDILEFQKQIKIIQYQIKNEKIHI